MTSDERRRRKIEYLRRWRRANRDRINGWQRAWRAENPELVLATRQRALARLRRDRAALDVVLEKDYCRKRSSVYVADPGELRAAREGYVASAMRRYGR